MKAKLGIIVGICVAVLVVSTIVWNSELVGNREAKEVAKEQSGERITKEDTSVQAPEEIVVEIKFRESFEQEDVIDDFIAKKNRRFKNKSNDV